MSTTIKMAEAVKLQDTLEKKINELVRERNQNSVEEIDKGEKASTPDRSVDLITAELATVREHLRAVKNIMRLSNGMTNIPWNNGQIAVSIALDLVKDIRIEAVEASTLGNRQKSQRGNNRFAALNIATLTVALYEPEKYRIIGRKGIAIADKLSMLIQESNLKTLVPVPFASEYMIVD